MLAKKLNFERSQANSSDLFALVGQIRPELRGTKALSSRAKRSYWIIAELVARGFTGSKIALGAWAQAHYLAWGQTKSISTIHRAFCELESAGYITRRQFRMGDILLVDFQLDKFDFYVAQNKRFKNPPCGTFSHTQLHTSKCSTDESRRLNGCNNRQFSEDVTTSKKSKKSAKTKRPYSDWMHPLVYSIGCLCYTRGAKYRVKMQTRVQDAIDAGKPPFDYWTAERWQTMGIRTRENEARTLLKALEDTGADSAAAFEPTEVDTAKLNQFFADFSARMSIPTKSETVKPQTVEKKEIARAAAPSLLTADELEVLQWANKNKLNR